MSGASIVAIDDPAAAYAVAMKWAARHEPFRSTPLGLFGRTILEAVRRGHIRFAVEPNGRVVGFGCWAFVSRDGARRLIENSEQLRHEDDGEVVALMLGASEGGGIGREALRHMAALYPGRSFVMQRAGRDRPVSGRFPQRR